MGGMGMEEGEQRWETICQQNRTAHCALCTINYIVHYLSTNALNTTKPSTLPFSQQYTKYTMQSTIVNNLLHTTAPPTIPTNYAMQLTIVNNLHWTQRNQLYHVIKYATIVNNLHTALYHPVNTRPHQLYHVINYSQHASHTFFTEYTSFNTGRQWSIHK